MPERDCAAVDIQFSFRNAAEFAHRRYDVSGKRFVNFHQIRFGTAHTARLHFPNGTSRSDSGFGHIAPSVGEIDQPSDWRKSKRFSMALGHDQQRDGAVDRLKGVSASYGSEFVEPRFLLGERCESFATTGGVVFGHGGAGLPNEDRSNLFRNVGPRG